MRRLLTAIAAGAILIAHPVTAMANDLDAAVQNISDLFDIGFGDPSDGGASARNAFLEIARIAEDVLATHPDLDAVAIRDMHFSAANGYYYAAEKEHWMAKEAEDASALTLAKIEHLEKALAHQKIVFADGQDGFLVAEYLFGTALLVEHGMETDDTRTKEWSAANVAAARLRGDESVMLGIEDDSGAKNELATALLDYAEITGDSKARDEAMTLVAELADDDRSNELSERLN